MSIKVFSIGAKLSFNGKAVQSVTANVVVEAYKPNVLMAVNKAKEIIAEEFSGDFAKNMAIANHTISVYPLNCGCGVSLKEYLKLHDESSIVNADDIDSFDFDFDDLDDSALDNAVQNLTERYEEGERDWQREVYDSFKEIASYIGADFDSYYTDWDRIAIELSYSDEVSELAGARAIAWLENHIVFNKCKSAYRDGKRIRVGWAMTKSQYQEAYPTGICEDYVLHYAYSEFKKAMRKHVEHSWQKCDTIGDFLTILSDEMTANCNEIVERIGRLDWAGDIADAYCVSFDRNGEITDAA